MPSPIPKITPSALFKLPKTALSTKREKIISKSLKIKKTIIKTIKKPKMIRTNPFEITFVKNRFPTFSQKIQPQIIPKSQEAFLKSSETNPRIVLMIVKKIIIPKKT